MRTRIKICCISSPEEARLAVAAGADAIGLVGEMPSGPGVIGDDLAREIAQGTPPAIDTFLLTSLERGPDIAEHARYCGTTTVQIVRHVSPGEYPALVRLLPATRRVQVIHVEDEQAIERIAPYERWAHAFLLDSGKPSAPTAVLGGTGESHDWAISAQIVRRSKRPVFLAGGLNPGNVGEAIRQVSPFGVDVCSGVRTAGELDRDKLFRFMEAVRAADGRAI